MYCYATATGRNYSHQAVGLLTASGFAKFQLRGCKISRIWTVVHRILSADLKYDVHEPEFKQKYSAAISIPCIIRTKTFYTVLRSNTRLENLYKITTKFNAAKPEQLTSKI